MIQSISSALPRGSEISQLSFQAISEEFKTSQLNAWEVAKRLKWLRLCLLVCYGDDCLLVELQNNQKAPSVFHTGLDYYFLVMQI